MSSSQGLQALVVSHMLPLSQKIQESSKFNLGGHDGAIFDIRFDELVALVMRDVGAILLEIYQAHFPHEVKGNQGGMLEETMWKMSEKNLFEFLKEYDICPSLLNKSVAFQIYQHTKNINESAY